MNYYKNLTTDCLNIFKKEKINIIKKTTVDEMVQGKQRCVE